MTTLRTVLVSIAASTCLVSATPVAIAQGKPEPSQLETTVGGGEGLRRVLYELRVSGSNQDVVRFEVPRGGLAAGAERLSGDGCQGEKTPSVERDLFVWECQMQAASAQLTFAVSASTASAVLSTGRTTVVVAGRAQAFPTTHVLKQSDDTPGLQAVVGGGFAFLRDDKEDFLVRDNTLVIVNDSPKRAAALAGILARIGRVKNHDVSLHSSFQFIQGDNAFLDGVSFGLGYELNSFAHVTMGVMLRKGNELGPGFRRDVAALLREPASGEAFDRFRLYDPSGNQAALDGIPLVRDVAGKASPYYAGDPIVASYNWSWYVGVVVPIRLGELIGKAGAKK